MHPVNKYNHEQYVKRLEESKVTTKRFNDVWTQMNNTIEKRDKTIEQLETENKQLKEKVENLENEIKDYLGQHDSSD